LNGSLSPVPDRGSKTTVEAESKFQNVSRKLDSEFKQQRQEESPAGYVKLAFVTAFKNAKKLYKSFMPSSTSTASPPITSDAPSSEKSVMQWLRSISSKRLSVLSDNSSIHETEESE